MNREKELTVSYRTNEANKLTEISEDLSANYYEDNMEQTDAENSTKRISLIIQSSSFDLGSARNVKGKTILPPREEGRHKSCSVRRVKAGCLGGRLRKSLNNPSLGSFTSLQKTDKCKYRGSYIPDEKHRNNSVAPLQLHRPRSADILDSLDSGDQFSSLDYSTVSERNLSQSAKCSTKTSTEDINKDNDDDESGVLVPVNVTGSVFEKYCRHRRSLIGIVYEKVNNKLHRHNSTNRSSNKPNQKNIPSTRSLGKKNTSDLSTQSLPSNPEQNNNNYSMSRSITDYSLHQTQNCYKIDDNCLQDYVQRVYGSPNKRSRSQNHSTSNSLSALCHSDPFQSEPEDYLSNYNSLSRRPAPGAPTVVKRSTSMPLNQEISVVSQNLDKHKSYHEETKSNLQPKSKLTRTFSIAAKARSMFKQRSRSRSNEGKLDDDDINLPKTTSVSPHFLRKATSVRSKSPFSWLFSHRDGDKEQQAKTNLPTDLPTESHKPPDTQNNTSLVKKIRLYRRRSRTRDKVASCPNDAIVNNDQKYSSNISKTESRISAFFRNRSKRRREICKSQSPDRLSTNSGGQYYSSSYKGTVSDSDEFGTFDSKLKRPGSRSSAESSLYFNMTKSSIDAADPDSYLANLTNIADMIDSRNNYMPDYSPEECPAIALQQTKVWLKSGGKREKEKSKRRFDRYPADAIPMRPKSLAATTDDHNTGGNLNSVYLFGGMETFIENASPTLSSPPFDEPIVPPLDDKRLSFLDHWPSTSMGSDAPPTTSIAVVPSSGKFHSELHVAGFESRKGGVFARSTTSLVNSASVAEHLDRISQQYTNAMCLRQIYKGAQNNKVKYERRTSSGHWSVSTSSLRQSNTAIGQPGDIGSTNQNYACPIHITEIDNPRFTILDRSSSKDSAVGLYVNSSCSATDKSESSGDAHSGSQRAESSCSSSATAQSVGPSPPPQFTSQCDATPTNTVKSTDQCTKLNYDHNREFASSDCVPQLNTHLSTSSSNRWSIDTQQSPFDREIFHPASSTETLSPQRSMERLTCRKTPPPLPPVRVDSLLKSANSSRHAGRANADPFWMNCPNRAVHPMEPFNEIENEGYTSSNSDTDSSSIDLHDMQPSDVTTCDTRVNKPSIVASSSMSKLSSAMTLVNYRSDYQSWVDLLPYKSSNLPQKLSERLKHSNTSLFPVAGKQRPDSTDSRETSRPVSVSKNDFVNRLFEAHSPVDSSNSSTQLEGTSSKLQDDPQNKKYAINPNDLTEALNTKLRLDSNFERLPRSDYRSKIVSDGDVPPLPPKRTTSNSVRDLHTDYCYFNHDLPYQRLPKSVTDSHISAQLTSQVTQPQRCTSPPGNLRNLSVKKSSPIQNSNTKSLLKDPSNALDKIVSLGNSSNGSSPMKVSLSRADSPSLGQYSRLYSLRVLAEFDSDVGLLPSKSSAKQITNPSLYSSTSNGKKHSLFEEDEKLSPIHLSDDEL